MHAVDHTHLFEEAQYANGQRGGCDEGADHTLDELGSRFAISMRTSAICVVSPYRAGASAPTDCSR